MVSVCQEQRGISVVHVCRAADQLPRLQHCEWVATDHAEGLSAGLLKLVGQLGLKSAETVAVLPPETYQLLQVELADLAEEERREAVRWQIRELLDFPAEEAVVDLYDVVAFQSEKRPLTYAVAARKKKLQERIELIQSSELTMSIIDIPEFALRNIADLFVADERGLAILLLLEDSGLLVIAREGTLYLTRSFSVGMSRLEALAAEGYEALSDQLDSIVLEIQRSFDYCESTFNLPLVSRLLVAQTARVVPTIVGYLNDYLTTSVEPFSFDGVLEVPEGIEQLQLNRSLLAIGGALRRETG